MGIAERKEREKQRRRNDIIDAAERIFFARGFSGATMDEVAEEAELSKGTLYLYFRSRDDLQFAIFMRGMDLLMKMMNQRLKPQEDGYHNLLAMAWAFIRFSREYPDYFRLFMHFESSRVKGLNIDQKQVQSNRRLPWSAARSGRGSGTVHCAPIFRRKYFRQPCGRRCSGS